MSTSLGLMIENRRERGFIYRRGMGVMEGAVMALLIVVVDGVEFGGGLLFAVEIREDVGFAAAASDRGKARFAVWSDLCDLLCASSRYFISNTSPSMISLTSSGGTACPLRRSQSCFAFM